MAPASDPVHPVSGPTVARIEQASGALATAAVTRMDTDAAWFRTLAPDQRASVLLVAQAGIAALVGWLRGPHDTGRVAREVFAAAPRELSRAVSLRQTVELVRVVVAVVEEEVPALARDATERQSVHEGVLTFSREIAFAAAYVYAGAAESRGPWDARLEALVVDGLVRDDSTDPDSQLAALGWRGGGPVTAVAGVAPGGDVAGLFTVLHRLGLGHGLDVLAGAHGGRLVVVVGGQISPALAAELVLPYFGPGPVVTGPSAPTLRAAGDVTRTALAGLQAAAGWADAPRPVSAEALLPERALAGEAAAVAELLESVHRPLADASDVLLPTVERYLAAGASLEATARALFVHTNTVRYRLGRVADVCGLHPTVPREAFTLQVALTLGRLHASPES